MQKSYLQSKFQAWFERVGALGDHKKFYSEIEKKYQTPQRFYHTLYGHIDFCIRLLYDTPIQLIQKSMSLNFL